MSKIAEIRTFPISVPLTKTLWTAQEELKDSSVILVEVRTDDGIEVNDLQLDIVIAPDGSWQWKDVQDLAPSLASGRITQDELLAVLAEADVVAGLLDRDERWWAPWDGWTPQGGMI